MMWVWYTNLKKTYDMTSSCAEVVTFIIITVHIPSSTTWLLSCFWLPSLLMISPNTAYCTS